MFNTNEELEAGRIAKIKSKRQNVETLADWSERTGVKFEQYGRQANTVCIFFDDAKPYRASLFWLSDYVLTSANRAGMIVLTRRN